MTVGTGIANSLSGTPLALGVQDLNKDGRPDFAVLSAASINTLSIEREAEGWSADDVVSPAEAVEP